MVAKDEGAEKQPFCSGNALDAARELLFLSLDHDGASASEVATGVEPLRIGARLPRLFWHLAERYLTGRRLERLKPEIVRGTPLSEATAATGLAGQSHMARHFKSPGPPRRLGRRGELVKR